MLWSFPQGACSSTQSLSGEELFPKTHFFGFSKRTALPFSIDLFSFVHYHERSGFVFKHPLGILSYPKDDKEHRMCTPLIIYLKQEDHIHNAYWE